VSDRQEKKPDHFEVFKNELSVRNEEIASLLPPTVSTEAFINTAIIAVKKNPDLLQCERRSLHNAVSNAAFDGLRPDGKEAVIMPQNEKVKVYDPEAKKQVEKWIKTARYQPMTYGIRKRARELDEMVIDAAVVHKNDAFDWDVGDEPYINHKPTALDSDPGPMIGVYAIFRRGEVILHREVMRASDVEAVKGISKSPDGLMWTKFVGEAWRKSVIKRGIKTVPCSPKLETVINRFDDMHDVGGNGKEIIEGTVAPRQLSAPPPPPPSGGSRAPSPTGVIEHQPATIIKGGKPVADETEDDFTVFRKQLAEATTHSKIAELQSIDAAAIMGADPKVREDLIELIEARKKQVPNELEGEE
jgi:recombination protein RecT